MDKMTMRSADLAQLNISKLRELFPECVTEIKTTTGGGGGGVKPNFALFSRS